MVSEASGESPLGHRIYLAEEAPKWSWATGHDLAARLGAPCVPCSEEVRGERGLAFSGQVLAANSVKHCQTLLRAMLIPTQ